MPDITSALQNLLTLVEAGGGMIIPLFICSLVTGAVILEQYWYSFMSARRLKRLYQDPTHFKLLRGMDMVSRMAAGLRRNQEASEDEQKRGMELIYNHFERRINWLNTLAAVAPLLGLLGTVSGMIKIFGIVATTKPDNPISSLSGGISEALFATGAGLIVAIFAALFYHYLSSRHERMGEEMASWYYQYRSKFAQLLSSK